MYDEQIRNSFWLRLPHEGWQPAQILPSAGEDGRGVYPSVWLKTGTNRWLWGGGEIVEVGSLSIVAKEDEEKIET